MKVSRNNKSVFLFQGVGADYREYVHLLDEEQKGMLSDYCSIILKELGLDLWKYLFMHSSNTKYDKAFCDWASIYTIDYVVYSTYVDSKIEAEMFLAYSMGLTTALACGNAISFQSGLQLLLTSYEYPKRNKKQDETMGVIIGLTYSDVENMISTHFGNNGLWIASENNEYCIVISGISSSIDKALQIAENEGALKCIKVDTPFAFHSPLAKNGIEAYRNVALEIPVFDSTIPIISCFDQKIIHDSSELRKELIRNLSTRMQWKHSMQKCSGMGISKFVEVSLCDSLTKFSKLISKDYEFLTYGKYLKLKLSEKRAGKSEDTLGETEKVG